MSYQSKQIRVWFVCGKKSGVLNGNRYQENKETGWAKEDLVQYYTNKTINTFTIFLESFVFDCCCFWFFTLFIYCLLWLYNTVVISCVLFFFLFSSSIKLQSVLYIEKKGGAYQVIFNWLKFSYNQKKNVFIVCFKANCCFLLFC